MKVKGKKIFVGLSGGVDSAVSATLLQKAGAEVTGVFIKGWYPPGFDCPWALERRDAMRVAARLRIPFITLDASAEYKKGVIDYLLTEYRAGRTPNPDVMCNREVKFGAFYQFAMAQGADAIATGHYRSGEKDQSYFLWAVPREAYEHTLFPVGHYGKDDVRRLARTFGLPVAAKKDSQGICFLGDVDMDAFLRSELEAIPGIAHDESGVVVGKHAGAVLFTLGQRVALTEAPPGPWYVVHKDVERNTLVVTKERQAASSSAGIHFTNANWLTDSHEGVVEAQCRYRGPRIPGHIEGQSFIPDTSLVETPVPGQSIVFYRGGELLGGGSIIV
jgi:tRNA-specific 2-thiouridylase